MTEISSSAFWDKDSLKSVKIPDGIKNIGSSAFYDCDSLENVSMPQSLEDMGFDAFSHCDALVSITIPGGLKVIPWFAFGGCKSLTSITLLNGVTEIGLEAFAGCDSLVSVSLPNSLEKIADGAFEGCSSLSSIRIPDSVTVIGAKWRNTRCGVFEDCTSLKNITLSSNLELIGPYTFRNCTSLKSVDIPDGLETIGAGAFENCTSLTKIDIPNSCTNIYAYAFYGCDSLTKAVIRNKDCYIYSNSGTFIASDGSYKVTIYGWEGSTAEEYADDYGYTFTSLNEVGKFVERLYNVILGRSSDAAGKANWTNKLVNGTKSAADIVASFFASDEYTKKNKSNSDIVEDCYKAMLNRASDSTGKANWIKYLNAGMSPVYVVKGFVGSTEFAKVCATYGISPGSVTISYYRDISYSRTSFVSRMYTKCLGRSFDSAGIENWCKHLANGMTGATLAKNFVFSKEYTNKKTSNAQFVTMLYQTLMGREPDQSGYNHWVSKLNSGTTRTAVFNGFAGSAEFKKLCNTYGIKAQ